VLRATEGVMPCFEIVDSRIQDWKIKIQDTVADNASCGVLCSAAAASPRDLDLALAGMVLEKNGEIISTSTGAAVQGSPGQCRGLAGQHAGPPGHRLKAGEVILSGSQSPLVPVKAGDSLVCSSLAAWARHLRPLHLITLCQSFPKITHEPR
jgi:2-oxopent-4-enoate/cis-2-oxohex-4-enoate hydratase